MVTEEKKKKNHGLKSGKKNKWLKFTSKETQL